MRGRRLRHTPTMITKTCFLGMLWRSTKLRKRAKRVSHQINKSHYYDCGSFPIIVVYDQQSFPINIVLFPLNVIPTQL